MDNLAKMKTKKTKQPSQTPILDLYYDFCRKGIPGDNGLCQNFEFSYPELWYFVCPTQEDLLQLKEEGCSTVYWGNPIWDSGRGKMTPLRQNIVLLLACLNNEL